MPNAMSNTGKGLIGAVSMTLGGLGAGATRIQQDLADSLPSFTSVSSYASFAGVSNDGVNRGTKTDRGPRVTTPAAPMHTISVQLHGVAETSVAVRIPRDAARP